MSSSNRASTLAAVSDEDLMARYGTGDAASFEEVFRRYEQRAYAFFLKRTGSRERSEDLYQELFLRIHRARDRYDPKRPFKPWLFQIANRLLIDDRRRAFRRRERPVEARDLADRQPSVDTLVDDRQRLRGSLESLSPGERRVLVATTMEGAGYVEVASELGKSVEAVRQMASRALRRLRRGHGMGPAVGSTSRSVI